MEFLYKLYSNNYFGIGLFIVITVLAFSFLVILFFGKKDEKKRSIKEKELVENKIEEKNESVKYDNDLEQEIIKNSESDNISQNTDLFDTIEINDISKLDNIDSGYEEKESTIELESFNETPVEKMDEYATSNFVLNSDLVSYDEPEEFEIREKDNSKPSDIYNLNPLMNEDYEINTEEESIDDVLNKYDAIEEKIIETQNVDSFDLNQEEEKPNEPIKKSSTPFSSVYLSKEEKTIKEDAIDNPKIEEPIATPSRPSFDLPKRMELPKRNNNAINENIISSLGVSREKNNINNNR